MQKSSIKLLMTFLKVPLDLYVGFFKLTGLYSWIMKSDLRFKIYVIPHRCYHTIRRMFVYGFSIEYILDVWFKRQLKNRIGECRLCGSCCKNCPSLVAIGDKNICGIYNRRDWCDVYFPVSKRQLDYYIKSNNINCGYSFRQKG
jgi:hypothetical protein